MEVIPVDQIPVEVIDTPVDNLMNLFKVCQQMEKICEKQNGIGISAVQVGLPWKFFIYRARSNQFNYMVDCEYEPIEGAKVISIEGCLSLRTPSGAFRYFRLERYKKVRIKGKRLIVDEDLRLDDVDFVEEGICGVVCQHEIDHHHQVLISDIGEEICLF